MFKLLCLPLALILFGCAAVSAASPAPGADLTHPVAPEKTAVIRVAEGLENGNMSVFHEYLNAGGNVLYSPYSLKSSLGILYPGIAGDSRSQIEDVLGFTDKTAKSLDIYDSYLSNVGVNSVNRTYLNSSYTVHTENLRKTSIVSMPFDTKKERRAVVNDANGFASENTEGRIKELLQEEDITSETSAVAVNALYFNKPWAFADELIPDDSLRWRPDGKWYQSVAIKDETGEWLSNVKTDGMVDITRLPYECGGGQFSLYLFTDNEEADREFVKEFLMMLDDEDLRKITNFGEYEGDESYDQVEIRFPKFEFSSRMKLPEMLKQAGMTQPFEPAYVGGVPNLDFADIADPDENDGKIMYLGNIIQSAFIKVDENGTEAAASTASMMIAKTALAEDAPAVKHVTADDPFGYMIKDETNNVVLFMGFVEDLEEIGQAVE